MTISTVVLLRSRASSVRIGTTNYVLVELAALLQCRVGVDGLRAITADILPIVDILWICEGLHRSAHYALLVSSRRRLSLVDCASFEAMRRVGVEVPFCFDPCFAEQGFTVLPAPP